MYVMGKTLWNRKMDFETIAGEYFQGAFGPDGNLACAYLARLSQLFQPLYTSDKNEVKDTEIYRIIREFEPIIKTNLEIKNQCIRNSWSYLEIHQEICKGLAKICKAKVEGDQVQVSQCWNEIKAIVQQKEDELQTVLDVFLFIHTFESKVIN